MPVNCLAAVKMLRDKENALASDQGFRTRKSTKPYSLTNLIKRDYRDGSLKALGR